jgi:hypothetical protein
MLIKRNAKNQITLPKSLVQALGTFKYVSVESRGGNSS